MKKVILFIIIGLSVACSKIQAQSIEFIYPNYREFVGYYYVAPDRVPLYYSYGDIKVKVNSTIEFDLSSASFWNGCTNFTWYFNLPGSVSTVYGRDQRIEVRNTGWASITVDAIDKDGYRHRNCSFMVEIIN